MLTVCSNENSYFLVEIAIENDLKLSARREKRMVALRSRLIAELKHLFRIMNDMNSDDNLSKDLTRFNKIVIKTKEHIRWQ